ncbi:MAG: hypothetical protein ACYSSO_14145, partial [Planctomycetota bacterium]
MVQKKSIQRWQQQPSRNLIQRFSIESTVPINHHRIGMPLAIILFCWATTCIAGGSGPGIGFKVGAQTM